MTDELTEFPTNLNPLPPETRQELREKRKARKVFAAVFSPFVKAMQECMKAYHEARAQGVQREDALKGLEFTLRQAWPKHVSKFPAQCADCDDTGYLEFVCRPYARCEREPCQRKGEDWQHLYARPCDCLKGQRFMPKVVTADVAAASVGKVPKRTGGFSRMGQ